MTALLAVRQLSVWRRIFSVVENPRLEDSELFIASHQYTGGLLIRVLEQEKHNPMQLLNMWTQNHMQY